MKGEKNLSFTCLTDIYCSPCSVLGAVLVTEDTEINKRGPALEKLGA